LGYGGRLARGKSGVQFSRQPSFFFQVVGIKS
jgi:hypothetical protein